MKQFEMKFKPERLISTLTVQHAVLNFVDHIEIRSKLNSYMADYEFDPIGHLPKQMGVYVHNILSKNPRYIATVGMNKEGDIKVYIKETASCWIEEVGK